MYQAGIKQITLYENKGISFKYWNPLNLSAITDLASTGKSILIENISQPTFDIKLKFGNSGKVLQDFTIEFLLLGLTLENYETLNSLKTNIYGWCFLVEFYDGTQKYYHIPTFCRQSEIKPHDEMSFKVTLQTAVGTDKNYFEYSPGVPLNVYRLDTEQISWDTEIFTFDYEL